VIIKTIWVLDFQPLGPILNVSDERAISRKDGIVAQAAMSGGTGPKILFRESRHAGSNRVALDVSDRIPAVILLHGNGLKPTLPYVTNQSVFCIEVARVLAVRFPYCFGQRILAFRYANDVDMIVHQRICPNKRAMKVARISQ